MLRSADVAKMLPCVPAAMTATEATKTMKSGGAETLGPRSDGPKGRPESTPGPYRSRRKVSWRSESGRASPGSGSSSRRPKRG